MGTFRVALEIGDPQGEWFDGVEALVDTWAAYTTLPASLLRRLSVSPYTSATFQFADGDRKEFPIGQTWVRLDGGTVITLPVFADERVSPLVGAYTLEGLRGPDPVNQSLARIDLSPLMSEVVAA